MGNVIWIVGIGPGAREFMTGQAVAAIEASDVVVGYSKYVELIRNAFPGKEFRSTGMTREIERCALCFDLAAEGKRVALVCSGDAGVYGMASPMLELSAGYPDVERLSDLLTPWPVIEKRLTAAIEADFALAIYNPASHNRPDYLAKACGVMLRAGAREDRACGYVENIGRAGETAAVCTLGELKSRQVNMFTTVFIGNSQSYLLGNKIVTKRGYL